MKNIKKYFIIMLLVTVLTLLVSCDKSGSDDFNSKYEVLSEFYYSSDAGKTYGNRTKEFNVGETTYMQVIVTVLSEKKKTETVTMTLTIPQITAVDSTYYDGQPITPIIDDINNITKYDFTVLASKEPRDWSFTFQFVPNSAGTITMTLEFDDKIPAIYDKQNTVKFNEQKNDESTEESDNE